MLKLSEFSIFLLFVATASTQDLLKVSIFYESLCPDSIRFITTQLQPTYPTLGNYINVDFLPYGKANHELVDGQWQFTCQHGPRECYGNRLQACALNQNQSQENNVMFVACVMASSDPSSDSAVSQCADSHGFSWDQIVQCKDDGTGDALLVALGDRTHQIMPSFVPTIVYNDVFDQQLQDSSILDFLSTACSKLGDNKPTECPGIH